MIADVRLTRRSNIKMLSGRYESLAEFARRCAMNPAQLNQVFKIQASGEPLRYVGEKLARRIESCLGLEIRWLDAPRDEQIVEALELPGARPSQPRAGRDETAPRIPHLAVASGTFVSVEGLSHLQMATVDALARLAKAGGLPERECLRLLESWTTQREQVESEEPTSSSAS